MFFWLGFNAIIAYLLTSDNPSLVHKHFWIGMFLIFGVFAFPFFCFAKHDPTKQRPLSPRDLRENQLGGLHGRCPHCGSSLNSYGMCYECRMRIK